MAKRKNLNEIMQAIASSPDDGMKIFYDDYGKFIFAVAFSVTKKKHLADEAVNEILFRIWKFSSKKNKTVDEGWLYAVCLNASKTVLRRNFFIPIKYECESGKNEIELKDEKEFFNYLSFVNSFEKEILILRFVNECTFDEISETLNKKLSSVTSAYYRALKKIEKAVLKYERT